jgi:hypothetical protein
MTVKSLFNEFLDGTRNPKSIGNIKKIIKKNFDENIINDIEKYPGEKYVQKVYNYIYLIKEYPKCQHCKKKNARFSIHGYDETCSKKM